MRFLPVVLSALLAPRASFARQWYMFSGDSSPFDATPKIPKQVVMTNAEEDILAAAKPADRSQHWRPQVHFSPPINWMNDPNGLFLDSKGVWHLYYQCELAWFA